MNEVGKILEPGEKVMWEGGPKFWPFLLGGITAISAVPVGVIVYAVFLSPVLFEISLGDSFLGSYFGSKILTGAVAFAAIMAVVFAYRWLVYKNMYYMITSKRVIIQKGLIGRDFEIIDFDKITNAEVNVGILDKLFGGGSGSILLSSAGTMTYTRSGGAQKPYTFSNVINPYDVFKFFKKVSHDVKTDIEYPNQYRPGTNPGYRTGYDPTQK